MKKVIQLEDYQDKVIECNGYEFTFKAEDKDKCSDFIRAMELMQILDHPEKCKSKEEYMAALNEIKEIRGRLNYI